MKKVVLSVMVASCVLASPALAVTRLVPDEYPSIQMAIQDCNNGDTVVVSPGVYYETINFGGKNIVVTGTDPNDPKIVGYTIIDADGDGSTVTFENGETSAAVLTGFTITGGFGTFNNLGQGGGSIFWGGGIYCLNASPTITRNIITRNYGPVDTSVLTTGVGDASYGGGIAAIFGSPTITHNIIRDNEGLIGGGLILYVGNAYVGNNVICNNSAYIGGGVVQLGGTLINNTVVYNDCSLGGDGAGGNVYVIFGSEFGRTLVSGNIIANAGSGGGMLWEGDMAAELFRYNNVWDNAMGNYITISSQTGQPGIDGEEDRTGTMGNISQDPLFENPLNKNYHLTLDSPCVNAGDPQWKAAEGQIDIDGQPRVYGLRIDIGADEYVGYVKPAAFAGYDQHVLQPLETVTLDGTGSFFYDPSGVKTFQWTQVEGAAVTLSDPTSATPTFVPQAMGEYVFELVVADDRYTSEADRVLVLVADNQPPVADAGPDRACATPGRAVLDGTGSRDPDVIDRLQYTWKQVDGPMVELQEADTATPFFVTDAEGQYAFELVVSDGFAASQPSRTKVVTVGVMKGVQNKTVASSSDMATYYPDMSGDKIVYVTGGNILLWQIACKDLNAGTTETFTAGGVNTQPKIDGNLVVWTGGASFNGGLVPECTGVYVRNLSTGVQQAVRPRTETSSFSHPAVSRNKIVWVEHRGLNKSVAEKWYNMPYDICGCDMSNSQKPRFFTIAAAVGRRDPFPLTDPADDVDVVAICDDMVVWEAQGDIYAAFIHDTNDIRVVTVCDAPGRQYDPAICGRFVVWTDERNDAGDIYGADISDLDDIREYVIARKAGPQHSPAIDGRQVVYVDGGTVLGSLGIACVTRQHGVLDTGLSQVQAVTMPAIEGTTLVWLPATQLIQGGTLTFGYSIFDGRVHNATSGKKYDYIQHAVSGAEAGDRLVLEWGAYLERINFAGKAVTICSTDPNDPDVVSGTVIQSQGGALVTFATSEGADSVLDGVTLLWGDDGVSCYGASPTIRRCNITANRQAGLRLQNQSNPTVTNCRITANEGAGVELISLRQGRIVRYSQATLRNCVIAANRQEGISGGKPNVINCTITENLREGITATVPTVTNSIIYFNNGGGTQINSNFATVTYSDIQGGWDGEGNIQVDPCFVESGRWVGADEATGDPGVWWTGDYHLKSQGRRWDAKAGAWVSDDVTSLCIDAGDPASSLLDEPVTVTQPNGEPYANTRIDMGVYGGTAEASLVPAGK